MGLLLAFVLLDLALPLSIEDMDLATLLVMISPSLCVDYVFTRAGND